MSQHVVSPSTQDHNDFLRMLSRGMAQYERNDLGRHVRRDEETLSRPDPARPQNRTHLRDINVLPFQDTSPTLSHLAISWALITLQHPTGREAINILPQHQTPTLYTGMSAAMICNKWTTFPPAKDYDQVAKMRQTSAWTNVSIGARPVIIKSFYVRQQHL